MFTPGPDGTGLAGAAGEDGAGAGADVAACAVGPDAAGDGRGHSRNAPSPARASTMTMNATLRCADAWSMAHGLLPAADRAKPERAGRAGHAPPLAGRSRAGTRSPLDPLPRPAPCPGERVKDPPWPQGLGAARPGAGALGAGEPAPAADRGGAPEGAGRGAAPGRRAPPGSVPPRAQLEGAGGPDSPSRDGSFSGGGVRPAPLLPVSAPRTRPRPAPLAREPEPACCESSGPAPSPRGPEPLAAWPLAPSEPPAPAAPAAAPATAPAVPPVATPAARLAACPGLRLAHRAARYPAYPGTPTVAASTVFWRAVLPALARLASACSREPITPYPTAENRWLNGLR